MNNINSKKISNQCYNENKFSSFFQNNKCFENKNKYIGYFYNGFIDNNNYSKYEGINDYNTNFGGN